MGRSLPCEAILRNRYGDSWELKIAHYPNTDAFWFEKGWRTFAVQNKLAYNDLMLFKFDGKSTFEFQLFDEHDYEKEYVRIGKSEEEKRKEQLDGMETEHVFPEFESMQGERGNMHPEPVSEEWQQQPNLEEQQEMQFQSEVGMQLEPEPQERQDMQLEQQSSDREEITRSRRTVRQRRGKLIEKNI